MVKLSILDQSPIREGFTPVDAIRETVDLAKAADKLGYHRYWVAEHHNSGSFGGAAPEILIGKLAQETDAIRVGSGGVMLSHYSPLKVAEQFRMLEALYPGRIDLGVGRAPGGDPRTNVALQSGPQSYDLEFYPTQVELTRQFITGQKVPENPFQGVHAMPMGDAMPEMWMLGSGRDSAVYAGQLGYPYSFAHFIGADHIDQSIAIYREQFRPSLHTPTPRVSIGLTALCAETEEQAEELIMSARLWTIQISKNQAGPFPSVETAKRYPYTQEDFARLEDSKRRAIVGTPDTVRARIETLAETHDAEEIFVVTITHDHQARIRSYELLANAFGL